MHVCITASQLSPGQLLPRVLAWDMPCRAASSLELSTRAHLASQPGLWLFPCWEKALCILQTGPSVLPRRAAHRLLSLADQLPTLGFASLPARRCMHRQAKLPSPTLPPVLQTSSLAPALLLTLGPESSKKAQEPALPQAKCMVERGDPEMSYIGRWPYRGSHNFCAFSPMSGP